MGPLLNPELPGSVPQGLPWHWILEKLGSTYSLLLVKVRIHRKLMYLFQSWYPLISSSIDFSWFLPEDESCENEMGTCREEV